MVTDIPTRPSRRTCSDRNSSTALTSNSSGSLSAANVATATKQAKQAKTRSKQGLRACEKGSSFIAVRISDVLRTRRATLWTFRPVALQLAIDLDVLLVRRRSLSLVQFHELIRDFQNGIFFRPVAIVSTRALVTPHHRPYRPSMSRPRHRRIGEISGVLVCGPPIRGFRISKFRCYVSFRRSLRAPHHI